MDTENNTHHGVVKSGRGSAKALVCAGIVCIIGLATTMIVIGATQQCENNDLKVWLIVQGSTLVIGVVLALFCYLFIDLGFILKPVCGMVALFMGIWLVVGAAWIFGYTPTRCDDLVFKTVKFFLITCYAICGLVVFCGCALRSITWA